MNDSLVPGIGFTEASLRYALQPNAQSVEITRWANKADWFVDCLQEVSRLSALPHNWDDGGSPRVTKKAQSEMLRLLTKVAYGDVRQPHIGAVPGGGLQIEWNAGPKYLELEVLPDGDIHFLTAGDNLDMQEGVLRPERSDLLHHYLGWLTV